MAWDFSTDPEFERQLEWMRDFVREEVWPIEAIEDRLTQAELDRINEPLQEQVRERGLWAAHLPPELGGQGFGQVKLGLMNEILGTSIYAPPVFGCQAPDSGNSEILALAGTPEQKQRWLQPLLDGELRSAFSMTEPATPGSDPTQLASRAVRDGDGYVLDGHKWFTSNGSIADFLIVMAVTDPDAPPHQRASMFIVPVDTPGRDDRPRRADDGAPAGALRRARRALRDPLRGRPPRRRRAPRRRGRGLPDRPEATRPGPHPSLHALAGHGAPRLRRDVRARALPAASSTACCATRRPCRPGSPIPPPRCRPPA